MIAVMFVASFLTGFALALILLATWSAARMSRSQEYMQRKVDYWISETAYARNIADRCTRRLAAYMGQDLEPPDWPPLASG